ncbi:MAG TPA: YciI family protein [Gemmatimonadales bacterium]|nr:YciI family protein [Gemmatimonadales bacterium]
MKYLCLIYENEKAFETISPAEGEAIMTEYFTFTSDIQKNGKYVAGEALQPTQTATTVRVRNGKVSTTDGPFAETKEQLGGFYMIEAKDLNDAIQVAARIPGARYGSIEVRPIMDFSKEAAARQQAAGATA